MRSSVSSDVNLYLLIFLFFFFNDTATTEIYTLSLHDALPIYVAAHLHGHERGARRDPRGAHRVAAHRGRGMRAVEEQVGERLPAREVIGPRIGLGERHEHGVLVDH